MAVVEHKLYVCRECNAELLDRDFETATDWSDVFGHRYHTPCLRKMLPRYLHPALERRRELPN